MMQMFNNIGQTKPIFVLYKYSDSYEKKYKSFFTNNDYKILPLENEKDLITLILSKIYRSDIVFVIHGMNYISFTLSFCVPFRRCNFNWVCWGSGVVKHANNNLRGISYNFFKRIIYNSLDKINCLLLSDATLLKEKHMIKTKISLIPYPETVDDSIFAAIPKYFNDGACNILVGNHAGSGNNHKELLNKLIKFKNENIRIVVPLNYGNKNKKYIESVIEYGQELFDSKFYPIIKLLPFNDYLALMKSIDVTIIDTIKQTGLAAIYYTIRSNGLVILKRNGHNVLWMNYLGIKVKTTEFLDEAKKIEDLSPFDQEQLISNKKKLVLFFDKSKIYNEWFHFMHE